MHGVDIVRQEEVAGDRAGKRDVDFHGIQGGNVESRCRRRRRRRRHCRRSRRRSRRRTGRAYSTIYYLSLYPRPVSSGGGGFPHFLAEDFSRPDPTCPRPYDAFPSVVGASRIDRGPATTACAHREWQPLNRGRRPPTDTATRVINGEPPTAPEPGGATALLVVAVILLLLIFSLSRLSSLVTRHSSLVDRAERYLGPTPYLDEVQSAPPDGFSLSLLVNPRPRRIIIGYVSLTCRVIPV